MSTSFKEMVQKTVNAKAKTSLRSSIMVWDHRLFHNTSLKIQIQDSNNKNSSRFEELKLKNLKPAPPRDNAMAKPAKKEDKKDKKKRF